MVRPLAHLSVRLQRFVLLTARFPHTHRTPLARFLARFLHRLVDFGFRRFVLVPRRWSLLSRLFPGTMTRMTTCRQQTKMAMHMTQPGWQRHLSCLRGRRVSALGTCFARAPATFSHTSTVHRLNSSLHTIRAMDLPPFVDNDDDNTPVATKSSSHSFHPHRQKLHFPFKDNTIARRARSPSKTELDYQLARKKRSEGGGGYHSGEGSHDERSPLHSGAESEPVEQPAPSDTDVEPRPQETRPESLPDLQHTDTETRLSEHTKIIRKDKLAARLQQVFGLDEQEEVLEEMNCWLLRNFSECPVCLCHCSPTQCSRVTCS